ncbi:putative methionine--tRNA ligase [Camellia lanceoleosa]|uniref:Methionine--tRNA ligase n=1 Tax=Camellia lanceoleosa TaxID=1840588 RepID=A0ACC0G3F6_9ERIC|nr:putative methionine--tRNA ligase [Camellia lanceoleosa]
MDFTLPLNSNSVAIHFFLVKLKQGLKIAMSILGEGNAYLQKDEEVEFFRQKFAGSQADRILKAEAKAKELAEQLKKTQVSGYIPPVSIQSIVSSISYLWTYGTGVLTGLPST